MVGAVVWTKEIMAPALLLPILLALTAGPHGQLSFKRINLAELSQLLPALLVFVAATMPVLATYASSDVSAFATRYGSHRPSLVELVGSTISAMLPVLPGAEDLRSVLFIGLTLFIVAAGWLTALRHLTCRAHHAVLLVAAIGLPLSGAVIYSPWPSYLLIYAMPFMVGGALLFGNAVSSLSRSGSADRVVAGVCLAPVITFAIATAANTSARTVSLHAAVASSVPWIAKAPQADSVMVAVAANQFDPRGNFGPRFQLYARMLDLDWPPVRDVTCEDAARIDRERVLVLTLSAMCPAATPGDTMMVFAHDRYDWPNPVPRRDSVTVAIRGIANAGER
jgi:hypothetical protein